MKVQDRIKAIRLMERLQSDIVLSKCISVRLVEKEKTKESIFLKKSEKTLETVNNRFA